jgi:hypothetical protein
MWGHSDRSTTYLLLASLLCAAGGKAVAQTQAGSTSSYPFQMLGAWGGWDTDPAAALQACESYRQNPKAVAGELLVFQENKKLSYGGYVDYTDRNVSVRALTTNKWQIVDRHYHDGEGGGKPGYRNETYEATLEGDGLTVKQGKYTSRFRRCAIVQSKPPQQASNPQAKSRPQSFNIVEPDLPYASVGRWKVSTARFGVGCVAQFEYQSGEFVSIGGETLEKMVLLVEVSRKLFNINLDDEREVEDNIELVIGQNRWSKLSPYGYRGTPGVTMIVNTDTLNILGKEISLKLTERGSVKLVVQLQNNKDAIGKLFECFKLTR